MCRIRLRGRTSGLAREAAPLFSDYALRITHYVPRITFHVSRFTFHASPMSPPLDILCVADMCVDLILTGNVRPRFGQVEQLIDDYAVELGGSANLFASQFARLGGSVGVVGCVGDDSFGEFLLEKLLELGVDTRHVAKRVGLKTGIGFALAEPDDRAILTYLGSIDSVQPSDLTDEMLSSCRHWHLASYFLLNQLRSHWKTWLQKCRAAGLSTSLDTNWDPDEGWRDMLDLLPLIDVFLPNEAEALAISGEADLGRAGQKLSGRCPLVVVKCGERGSIAFKDGGTVECAVPDDAKPTSIIDNTGAGDNFDAGFLRAWLLGKPVEECMALGCRCGAASLSAAGGIAGQLVGAVAGPRG